MKKILFYIFLFSSFNFFSQNKPFKYYNENGKELTKKEFSKAINYSENLDLYLENDSLQFGVLMQRENSGKLNQFTLKKIQSYLHELSKKDIDSTKNIVINYLTALPNHNENTNPRSTWNVLEKDYLKKLSKISKIQQFWINSPRANNLKYYYSKRINWLEDKEDLFKKIFFPYEVKYGNFILIKPDGRFYYYLGEHSKYQIWETSKKFF